MNFISVFSTIVTFIFAAAVLNRYRHNKHTHLLLWGIGLILYGTGTLTEVLLSLSFNPYVLKFWYLCGAMLTAAWLGQGTVYLLVRKRGLANAIMAVLALASILALVFILISPVTSHAATYNVSHPASEQYKDILVRSGMIILLTILLNIYGTLALVGGAVYSAYLFWRKKVLFDRMIGSILIAVGALMPAMAGSFVGMGLVDLLYVSEFIGVVIMYIGFLRATSPKAIKAPTQAASMAK